MHVFVTGGTGTIGKPVVNELITHGHTVSVLARSDASAAAVEQAGARAVRGSLTDLDVLRDAAREADGVIALAFRNDFSSAEAVTAAVEEEAAELAVFGEAMAGSGKPIVTSGGTPAVPGRASTEADPMPAEGIVGGRATSISTLLGLADRGVRPSVVRLPRTVHADGDGGFAGLLTRHARATGFAGYPGDGTQRWPAVHALDAAVLFRLALEHSPAGRSWQAVADEADPVRDITAVIARRLGVPTGSEPLEAFGPLGAIFAADQPASSERTRAELGWTPTHPSLLQDLELITA